MQRRAASSLFLHVAGKTNYVCVWVRGSNGKRQPQSG